jgi:hypothetical protein
VILISDLGISIRQEADKFSDLINSNLSFRAIARNLRRLKYYRKAPAKLPELFLFLRGRSHPVVVTIQLAFICDECLTWYSDCIAILAVRYNRMPILSTHYKCAQCNQLALICDECLTWYSDCIAILAVRYNRTPILSTHYKCAQCNCATAIRHEIAPNNLIKKQVLHVKIVRENLILLL